MKNWYKTSQERTAPLFFDGQDVTIDTVDVGSISGVVDATHEFRDGEWYYKVMVDDTMSTHTIPESNMKSE